MKSHPNPRVPWAPADLASLLFPQRCPLCDGVLPFAPRIRAPLPSDEKEADIWVHPACHARVNHLREPLCACCGVGLKTEDGAFCKRCQANDFHFRGNRALWPYEEPARSAVTRFKYHGRQQYALYFARAWWGMNREYFETVRPQILIPVPIHRSRLRKRGYNQASLFAYELEKLSGIPCREDVVIRSKHTGAQKELGPAERLINMENAFRIKKRPEGIKRVMIVDDIYTTGSTLESISRLLSEAGIREIYAATLCVVGER